LDYNNYVWANWINFPAKAELSFENVLSKEVMNDDVFEYCNFIR